ncbi:NTP transferase domain-containing protein [Bacillus infantis]|uniref:NTP transferase domain-containing protein n=1 Tax=Bacillus infantis TaxID=324767 RepID=UPI002003CB20|nr:NTP transferase domain-containing protein [Bacillus infantis]MCK6206825.1 NTP transferase domain-containing protein [Bacillus infantis]
MKIAGIYLAAGRSRRMGKDKRFLPYHGMPLGSAALGEALVSRLDHIVIVTEKEDSLKWLQPSFLKLPYSHKWSRAVCREAARGQGHSISCGIREAVRSKADAAVILLADQPFVRAEQINRLIDCYKEEECLFVAPASQKVPMPPVLFSSACFPLLQALKGDQGARSIIRGELFQQGKIIDFQKPLLFYDVDTPEDYEVLKKLRGE